MIQGQRVRGYALLTILLLAGLFLTVAGAIGSEVLSSLHATRVRTSDSAARFAAYAGLQHAIYKLKSEPDFSENLVGFLVPGNSSLSYAVYITNNSKSTSSTIAVDGTEVPPQTVYCVAMGADGSSTSGEVSLHAMSGLVSEGNPTLSYAAFSDHSVDLKDYSKSFSFDSSAASFVPGPNERLVLDGTLGESGTMGSNRYVEADPTVEVHGDIRLPPGGTSDPSILASVLSPDKVLQDLPNPLEIPRYSSPGEEQQSQAALTAAMGMSLSVANDDETAVYDKLTVSAGGELALEPGRYFFRQGMDIAGALSPGPGVSPENPVVIFLGDNAVLSDTARVNLGGRSASFQFYFVDHAGEEARTFTMNGNSQMFATVVGSRLEATVSGNAELYGAFLGRSMRAQDFAKLIYDESLASAPLAIAADWGLNGITEPEAEVVMSRSPVISSYVISVKNDTLVPKPPVGKSTLTNVELEPDF